jgi:nucleoside-diphosphate-sugar epimerase
MDENLLRAVDPGRGSRVVYVCGSSYIGRAEDGEVLDESSPSRPFGTGPVFEAGLRALRLSGAQGLDYAVAFVGGVYGRRSWFVQAYLAALAAGEPIPVLDPAPRWPYVHVEDCARAIALLATADSEALAALGREIIVADDEPTRMDVFIEEVARAAGKPVTLRRLDEANLVLAVPSLTASYLTADMPHSNRRLRQLGFTCLYPTVREGMASLGLGSG